MADPTAAVAGDGVIEVIGILADPATSYWLRDAIVSAVQNGRLDAARLDEAAARVTALAGGDAKALTCRDVALPSLTG